MISFKGAHFVKDIILTCVRWYLAYPLSYRQVEELMEERGVSVDHATINRWVLKYSPPLEEAFHRRKRPVGRSWRMDETYMSVTVLCRVKLHALTVLWVCIAACERRGELASGRHGTASSHGDHCHGSS
jgi:hypothetical protein